MLHAGRPVLCHIAAAAHASFQRGTSVRNVSLCMTSEFFFLTGTCREDPQFFTKRVYFQNLCTAPTRGKASTTGQDFLGNKRLGTFQITESRLRDQTTVGSNYLLGEEGCGPNGF